jgi:hypothetical protein
MSSLSKTGKIDLVNIGLLIFSCALAFVIPFELFLFVYAVLGPLHYLTEISWLHDKNYYTKSKKDVILLVVISLFLTALFVFGQHFPEQLNEYVPRELNTLLNSHLTFVAFGAALFMALIKKPVIRAVGIILTVLLVLLVNKSIPFFTVFLPTLVHVFLFTSLFMLYGALRSKSKMGLLTVALHIICPFLLFYMFQGGDYIFLSDGGKDMYGNSMFAGLNFHILQENLGVEIRSAEEFTNIMFNSNLGVAVMRFIAFAYTYHYLNWFSKTEIIRWHKVPKSRFVVVIVAWIVSIVLYAMDYSLGFQWLFLLSFMHVLLEFPLNYVSVVGIFQELRNRSVKTA